MKAAPQIASATGLFERYVEFLYVRIRKESAISADTVISGMSCVDECVKGTDNPQRIATIPLATLLGSEIQTTTVISNEDRKEIAEVVCRLTPKTV